MELTYRFRCCIQAHCLLKEALSISSWYWVKWFLGIGLPGFKYKSPGKTFPTKGSLGPCWLSARNCLCFLAQMKGRFLRAQFSVFRLDCFQGTRVLCSLQARCVRSVLAKSRQCGPPYSQLARDIFNTEVIYPGTYLSHVLEISEKWWRKVDIREEKMLLLNLWCIQVN